MAEKEFLKGIAFSNLAGNRFSNFLRLLRGHKPEPKYYWRTFLNLLLSAVLSLLAIYDSIVYSKRKKIPLAENPPVFVLGHWRSGTTHLHNLLCMHQRAGYVTTFQTVLPNHLFGFNKPLVWLMRKFMPATRPVDNVELDPNFPQEEEFGLGNVMEMSYYNWWYFPTDWDEIRNNYLSLNNIPTKDLERWKQKYSRFIDRALRYQNRDWFISKNPPNTARIKHLLEMYPDARFIYIHRNPYEVFVSSQRFFKAILGPLQLQSISDEDFNQQILKAYNALYDEYEAQKSMIPQHRLVEIGYAEFLKDELTSLRNIFKELEMDLPAQLDKQWADSMANKEHKSKVYKFDMATIKLVNSALGNRIERLRYQRLSPEG
jgi:hypothetical protein